MTYHLTENQFLQHFRNAEFVLKTQQQIAKDFERSGLEVHPELIHKALDLESLQSTVSEMLATVVQQGETSTLQLLYQIDIPQQQFLALTTDPDFLSEASKLIIRREAQKVYLRSIF